MNNFPFLAKELNQIKIPDLTKNWSLDLSETFTFLEWIFLSVDFEKVRWKNESEANIIKIKI